MYKTILIFSALTGAISEWKCKGLTNEKLMSHYIANVSTCLKLVWMINSRIRLKFRGSCL